jgi:hypothetical protein
MAIKNLSDVHITAGLQDKDGQLGTSGQILSSTGSQVNWINQSDIVTGPADEANSLIIRVKNSTATAMTKGQVVCAAVSASPPSGNLIEVALADNNGTNTMPAVGILKENLDASGGANDEGDAVMFGKVSGINTSAFSVGDEVFIDDTPGGLTITKPTGTKYIQKVGVVIRDHSNNGTIEVFGAGRVNDVPTPLYVDHANQRLGIDAVSPSAKLHVHSSDDNAYAVRIEGSTNNVANVWTGLGIGGEANNTKSALLFEDIGSSYSRGKLHLCVNNEGNQNSATPADAKLTISNDGNVGIGTTGPSEKLHVSGNLRLTGSFKDSSGDSGTAGQVLSSTGTGTNWINNTAAGITGVTAGNGLTGGGTSGTVTVSADYSTSTTSLIRAATETFAVSGGGTYSDYILIQGVNPGTTTGVKKIRLNNIPIEDFDTSGDLSMDGSIQMGNDTDTASASKAGTLRYRVSGNNSYVDMCMRTGATTYAWVNIVQNNW